MNCNYSFRALQKGAPTTQPGHRQDIMLHQLGQPDFFNSFSPSKML